MRCKALWITAGLALAPLLGLAMARGSDLQGVDPRDGKAPAPVIVSGPGPARCTTGTCGNTGKYNTAIDFVSTPAEAARLAKQEEKLVFVLHLSGIFENRDFT